MITKESIIKIEQLLRLENGTLLSAITNDNDIEIELLQLEAMTVDEKTTYETNFKEALKKELEPTIISSIENTLKEKIGLDFKVSQVEEFAKNFRAKVIEEEKINPDKKLIESKNDNEILKSNLKEFETKYSELQNQIISKEKSFKIQSKLNDISIEGLILPKEDIISLFKVNYEIDIVDNAVVVKKNDQIIKDKTLTPKPLTDVFKEFIEEKNLINKVQGRGNSNAKNIIQGTYEAYEEEMTAKNINQNSAEFQREMNKRIKEGTLKV